MEGGISRRRRLRRPRDLDLALRSAGLRAQGPFALFGPARLFAVEDDGLLVEDEFSGDLTREFVGDV
ncbi:hypothetical protein, partial [Streptomyces puniciscabiei]|uniref:hypothetical protein n=1 Tax=Streptomyces puniciscabiei TaxID=164348 RepID=UPI0006EB3297